MTIWFIFILVVQFGVKITLGGVETKINEYFDSDVFKNIQKYWQTERKAFQNAIAMVLEQNYGERGMNVYVRKSPDAYKIADGFYFSDNIVEVVLLRMYLQELPHIIAPDVQFALATNYLGIEGKLSKIIINTKYLLIRNQSDITFAGPDVDLSKSSPFTLQQVQDSGQLTIVADDCSLSGYTVTSLSGETVNLGIDAFKITNCKFTVEIYSPGLGSPPVITPYFTKGQRQAIERMMSCPIRTELMTKLQASIFSYINTSAIFGQKLPKLRASQKEYFKETANYVDDVVKNYANNAIENNQGSLNIKPLDISWKKARLDGISKTYIRLSDMILYGLNTVYSAHTGGPYKLNTIKVAETIRFSTMQVRGNLYFENTTAKGQHDFAVELRDVAVNVEFEVKSNSLSMVPVNYEFVGWRALEFSILDVGLFAHERTAAQSLITGYLINEIPRRLLDQFSKTFGDDYGKKQQSFPAQDSNDDNDIEKNKMSLVHKEIHYYYSADSEESLALASKNQESEMKSGKESKDEDNDDDEER